MPDHYFTETPASAHAPQAFSFAYRGHALRFETDAGVFSRDAVDKGTQLLLESFPEDFTGRALDLGCGWGAVGACMAAIWPGAEILLTDVNARAAELARQNLRTNGLTAEVFQGDGLAAVAGHFDLIALNPPIRAGKAVVYRLFEESVARLTPGGALLVVIRKQQGAESALRFLRTLLGDVQVVRRGGGFWVLRGNK
ncbi:MAG: class I SAM-dependent methyltransferase [Oscillospiraceae bacterium]|jgi:16S rRNA (guanine1207-N2)-methyltransferase|nr:class I SAM-dependent methyltransferase [Oscillospiraceae bacterium]